MGSKKWAGSAFRRMWVAALATGVLGCGSGGTGVAPDPAVAPFVGDWAAAEFRVTSTENPAASFDVTDGGSFTINIQPSGQYTAILSFPEMPTPVVELGQLAVIGASIRLSPLGGTPATSSYRFEGPDRMILQGPTQFDFNNDGTPDPAEALITLERSE
jgi:hypothetical protein